MPLASQVGAPGEEMLKVALPGAPPVPTIQAVAAPAYGPGARPPTALKERLCAAVDRALRTDAKGRFNAFSVDRKLAYVPVAKGGVVKFKLALDPRPTEWHVLGVASADCTITKLQVEPEKDDHIVLISNRPSSFGVSKHSEFLNKGMVPRFGTIPKPGWEEKDCVMNAVKVACNIETKIPKGALLDERFVYEAVFEEFHPCYRRSLTVKLAAVHGLRKVDGKVREDLVEDHTNKDEIHGNFVITAVAVTDDPKRPLTLERCVVDAPGYPPYSINVKGIAICQAGQHTNSYEMRGKQLASDKADVESPLLPYQELIPIGEMVATQNLSAGKQWKRMRGEELEAPLKSGATALVSAKYLLQLAGYIEEGKEWVKKKPGGIKSRRQDLPPEAFVKLDELRSAPNVGGAYIRVICISYPWLTPAQPDPRGTQIQLLGKVLSKLIAKSYDASQIQGVLLDFCSMHQPPRTAVEDKLFREGLGALAAFYSHPHTHVWKLTTVPKGYPNGYNLPAGANKALYIDRGWCYFESCLSQLTKSGELSLDMGALQQFIEAHGDVESYEQIKELCTQGGGRKPPKEPDAFAVELKSKCFTAGLEDTPLVVGLYKNGFTEKFQRTRELIFTGLKWGDAEMKDLMNTGAHSHSNRRIYHSQLRIAIARYVATPHHTLLTLPPRASQPRRAISNGSKSST